MYSFSLAFVITQDTTLWIILISFLIILFLSNQIIHLHILYLSLLFLLFNKVSTNYCGTKCTYLELPSCNFNLKISFNTVFQAWVVQRANNNVYWINLSPEDITVCFVHIYPQDSNLPISLKQITWVPFSTINAGGNSSGLLEMLSPDKLFTKPKNSKN